MKLFLSLSYDTGSTVGLLYTHGLIPSRRTSDFCGVIHLRDVLLYCIAANRGFLPRAVLSKSILCLIDVHLAYL